MNQDVPHKKTNKDKKNGMNSTLFVLITNLMMVKGEPYMMMEKTVAAIPQKSFLPLPWRAKRETTTTTPKTERTRMKSPRILVFSFLRANMMKIITYTVSITAPVPLIVDTSRLLGDTKGMPYQAESKQLSRVMT